MRPEVSPSIYPPPQAPMNRRYFLQAAGAVGAGFGMASIASLPVRWARAAAAQNGPRSLVCIFLAGGADSFNMYIPRDHAVSGQSHAVYAATRGRFAIPASELLPIGDGNFGLHPRLPKLAALAAGGDIAVIRNVGPLARPTTKADVHARRSLPQSLFAHDAQAKLWQTGRPVLTTDQGWGGSVSDAINGSAALPPAFSIAGSNSFQTSLGSSYAQLSPTVTINRLLGYDASTRGWIPSFAGVEAAMQAGLSAAAASTNRLDHTVSASLSSSIITTEQLEAATQPNEANDVGMDDVSGNRLGVQLRQVARLIKNRDQLGMPRQVFFVRLGGWDTHRIQEQIFPPLLSTLDDALGSFHASMRSLGVTDSVTTFTASDFGRTLTINGDGTDHGWGGHAFVMGGAVAGGDYGTFPSYATERNPDDIGDGNNDFAGRLIPTTSVSQYGATLARWMGLSSTQITAAFPDLVNFASDDLGFLT